MKIKFRKMPLGGRFDDYGRVFVVLQRHGDGLVVSEQLNPSELDPVELALGQSLCSFVDDNAGITLDTEVNFIGLDNPSI